MKSIEKLNNFLIFYRLYLVYVAVYVLILLVNLVKVKNLFPITSFEQDGPIYSRMIFSYFNSNYHSEILIFLIFLIFINLIFYSDYLIKFLIFIIFYNFNESYPASTDGGTTLTIIVLMLSIFAKTPSMFQIKIPIKDWEMYLSLKAIWAIKFEIIFMYLSACTLKLSAKIWTKGVATYYIFSQHDGYFSRFIYLSDSLVFISTYTVIGIQFLYPLSILLKKRFVNFFRFCFVVIILFHFFTWIGLNIFTFFLSAFFANLVFIDFSFLKKIESTQ